jgi:hypothetical protein
MEGIPVHNTEYALHQSAPQCFSLVYRFFVCFHLRRSYSGLSYKLLRVYHCCCKNNDDKWKAYHNHVITERACHWLLFNKYTLHCDNCIPWTTFAKTKQLKRINNKISMQKGWVWQYHHKYHRMQQQTEQWNCRSYLCQYCSITWWFQWNDTDLMLRTMYPNHQSNNTDYGMIHKRIDYILYVSIKIMPKNLIRLTVIIISKIC